MSVESDAVIALYVRLESAHMAVKSAIDRLRGLNDVPEEVVDCIGLAEGALDGGMASLRQIEPALALVASRLASKA